MRSFLALLLLVNAFADQTQQELKPPCQPLTLDELPCLPVPGLITDELPINILPYAGPAVTWSNDAYVQLDYIYWYVEEEGLSYARSQAINEVGSPVKKGHAHDPHFQMNSGFKLGVGIDLNRDSWDFNATYTWLQAHGPRQSHETSVQNESTLAPSWIGVNGLSPDSRLLYASSTFGLHFNVIDLALGKHFFMSRYMSLRPYIGMKGSWQTQDYHVVYQNEALATLNHYKMSINQDMLGIGPRFGMQGHLYFTPKWSLFGEIALSNLWTFFETWQRNWITPNFTDPSAATEVQYKALNSLHTLKAVMESSLGIEFDHWFACDEFHLSLRAAFETQNWWGQMQFFNPYEPAGHGDLSLAGLTAEIRLDF